MVYRGNRRSNYRETRRITRKDTALPTEDRLVKITLLQSMLALVCVAGFFIYSVGADLGVKKDALAALTTHIEPIEMVETVANAVDNMEDSYFARVAQQVINLYREPAHGANTEPEEALVGPVMNPVLEPSANIPNDIGTELPVDMPKEDIETPQEILPSTFEKTENVGLKLVHTAQPMAITSDKSIDINVPGDMIQGGVITSGFGFRIHPISGKQDYHTGVDIGAKLGTAIHTPRDGKVISKGVDYAYGNYFIIDHDNGLITYYSHCKTIDVKVGEKVKAGEAVATVGNTGLSTGPHLHFEIMIDGSYVDPQNPGNGWGVV